MALTRMCDHTSLRHPAARPWRNTCLHAYLLILSALMLGTSTGQTQTTGASDLPEPCRAGAKDDLATLENRKQRLEREIAEKTAALPPAADPPPSRQTRRFARITNN